MTIKKAFAGSMFIFLLMFILGNGYAAVGTASAKAVIRGANLQPPVQAATPEPDVDGALRDAFQQAVDQNRSLILGFQIYNVVVDAIHYSNDGQTAVLWLALQDQETGDMVETEPGLSIAAITPGASPSLSASWSILLQSEPVFEERLRALPPELLTEDIQNRFLNAAPEAQLNATPVFSGYKLPWTAGTAKRVTNSIGHVYSVSGGLTSCPTTCRYAFDFADGTMFPMLAAKGGTVKSVRWTCPNFDTNCTNYLILEDQSTSPTSYQVYYHLAHNSTPERLRTVGAVVRQGEFIGDVDDTGASTGHHLHYHVYTTPNASNWTWGNSVDITFDDVSDNGGRPRTCAEAREYSSLGSQCQTGNYYTSGNTPANPPQASLSQPTSRQVLTSRMMRVAGTASDDLQITRILVQANYNGTWKTVDEIAPNGNGPFSKDVDLCSANIPDGPFSLAVRVFDREGSQAGLPVLQMVKNFSNCMEQPPAPVPACIPDGNQVALFAEPDYRGACQKFDVSAAGYTADRFGSLGSDNAASIMVGGNVFAVAYDYSSDVTATRPARRVETFSANDPALSDNRIGNDHISGLWVSSRGLGPLAPVIHPIGNHLTGNAPTSVDSLVLAWDGGERGTVFDTRLIGPTSNAVRDETVSGNSISVGTLAPGSYTFIVNARNVSGERSSQLNFTVSASALTSATPKSVPYKDTMENGANGWTASGLWRLGATDYAKRGATQAWIYNDNTNYSHDTYRAGDLTSPPISIPATGTYYLNYAYFMDTEDGAGYWDRRIVQVSRNGGPFHDLYNLSGDKMENGPIWTYSAPISLKDYAGSTIRVRFHFDTLDKWYNLGQGWIIDDVSIDTQGPNLSCADTNNTISTAQQVAFGSLTSGLICPAGDLDYYKINARAGQQVTVDINAKTLSPASRLDSLVQLIAEDGVSVIAENDDEVAVTLQDSLLSYVVGREGAYYIKVKAWNYPGAAGLDYPYQMVIGQDVPIAPSSVEITYPIGNKAPAMPFTITAAAADFDGQPVAKMDFYWHSGDWSRSWVKLGTDTSGVDGWSHFIDPREYGEVRGGALYVQAISRTGGALGITRWDLEVDFSLPTSEMKGLPASLNSTGVPLEWTASDAQNDIDHFQVEYQENSGGGFSAWQVWSYNIPGHLRNTLFVGKAGSRYNFRMRAIDKGGNVEPYPPGPEATTSLASSCAPDPLENGVTADNPVKLARGTSPTFNFCKSQQDGSADVDWTEFDAQTGEDLMVLLIPQGSGASIRASLYNEQSQLLGTWASAQLGSPLVFQFRAPAAGKYYIEVKPTQPGLFGTDVKYFIGIGSGKPLRLPFVTH